MTMGDRVAVLRKGELQQVASPRGLYEQPVNLFVAGFIGSPAMNLLEARLERRDGTLAALVGNQSLTLDQELLSDRPALSSFEGREVILGIRPEELEDAALVPDAPPDRRLKGSLELREALGSEIVAHVVIEARAAVTEDVRELAADIGEDAGGARALATEENEATVVARFGPRSEVRERSPVEMVVDTRGLHFFDPETSLGIYENEKKT
jgi:multiple sugar transport system ATP-binding protein